MKGVEKVVGRGKITWQEKKKLETLTPVNFIDGINNKIKRTPERRPELLMGQVGSGHMPLWGRRTWPGILYYFTPIMADGWQDIA